MRIKSFRKEKSNEFYFRIFDKNEKQILRSEAYTTKAARDNGIASFKKNSANPDMYERKVASDGSFFFNVKASNGQVVATSLMFKSEEERESIIQSLLSYASGGDKAKASSRSTDSNDGKEQDDYMTVDFYENSGTETANGFDRFQKGDANHFYFSFKSDDGKVLLISQGYTAEAGRDNGIGSVEKNSKNEDRYTTHTEDGKYYFTIKAGNHQEVARSVDFDSAEDMTRAISIIMAGEGTFAPPVMAKASSASGSDDKDQDDYMSLDFYQSSGSGLDSGFDKFQGGDNNYYFFTYNGGGNVILFSQGYTAEAGRDNGIASVSKNAGIAKRYATKSEDGKYYFILKAGNHQEIGRSRDYDSEAEMTTAMNLMIAANGGETENTGSYYTPSTYRWYKGDDGSWYYYYLNDNGDLIFRSRPYTSESDAKSGAVSNLSSMGDSKLDKQQTDDNRWYFWMWGSNGTLSGASTPTDDEAGLDSGLSDFSSADASTVSELPEANAYNWSGYSWPTYGKYNWDYKWDWKSGASSPEEPVAPVVEAVNVVSTTKTVEVKTEKEDDYLPCKAYEGHDVNDKVNNVAFFKHENGQFYFVVYKEDGSVRLRSEGFGSAKERDVELSGMLKNINNPDMYSTIKSGIYAIHILKDATGREVGRSCLEKEEKAAPVVVEETPVVETVAAAAAVSAAASVTETNTEKEDDYLPCKEYEGHEVYDKENNIAFFKHSNGQYYFVVYKADGSVRLRSEGFESSATKDEELKGVIKHLNNPDMYTTIKRGKYSIQILKDETGREVGRSCLEKEEAAPVVVEPPVVETVAAAAAVTAAATVVTETKVEKEDDYLPCKAYEGHDINDKQNNVAFFKHENGQYYFVVYKEDGSVRLRSEGFGSAKERDVELSGMLKNINNDDMYSTIKRGKYSIHILKDADGREVGRSCLEKEEEAAPVVVETPVVETVAAAAAVTAAATVVTETKVEKEDDYLPCKAYEGHDINDKQNNVAFFKHENGQYYFVVYKEDGSVRLRSEGFGSAKERDVELSGMLKNINNDDMYSTIQRGKYSIHILKDKDGREVGRSCLEKEEEAAPVVVETVEAPVVEAVAAAAVVGAAAATVETVVDKEDDYLPCKEYEGHNVNDKENNVAFFKHENGQFYFAIYNEDGSVRLRSEGFRSAKERDSELSGALKGLNNSEMYETLRKGKYFMNVLKDKTGREVGRSCLQKEETPVVPPVAVAAAAVVAAPVVKEIVTKKKVEIEDDYLPCKAYEGHKITNKKHKIATFQHENGQHYFVVYKDNGRVKLRSEGFPSKQEMQGELNAVIKHKSNRKMYSRIEAQGGKYVIHVLKDENGKEVGRSCLEKAKKKKGVPPVAAAAAAATVVAAATTKVETVEEIIEPEPVVVETPKVVATAAGRTAGVGGATAAAETAASGGFKWWWLLPLLLLPLLFFWWKGCDTNTTSVATPPPVKEEVVAPTPEPEPEVVKEVAPPPAPTCNCNTRSNSSVFNLPSNAIPKSLTRLGTSPEFGNSHGLSPAQFYNKLKGAASANGRDKQFLDQVFKAMGYGGFSDATADMFSTVTLRKGTKGNMGFGGSKHRTIYATLNTSGRDLEAFKIKAANGCHLHFMKTCGNHFFFCPN